MKEGRWRRLVETELAAPLRLLAEAGGPENASDTIVDDVVFAARRLAESSRRDQEPVDRLVDAVVTHGDREVDELIAPWENDDPPDCDPNALLSSVVAIKRSVRLAVFSIDAYIRGVRRRRALERRRILDEFGRTLAHEIKNRLGAAETALMMLDPTSDHPAPAHSRIYDLIDGSLKAALCSVDEVRSLSMYRDPSTFPTMRPERLQDVLRRAIRDMRIQSEVCGVHVALGDVPELDVHGGPVGLVMSNLIGNGVKYSDPERDKRWVRVSGAATDAGVSVVVEDNGVGIPAEHHERIFDQSVRVTTDGNGSGLGLAIVRDAVRQLGGTIDLESETGRGTRITISFPTPSRNT